MKADRIVLGLAQGLGTGRSPVAPGTVGSLLGLAWTALLFQWGPVGCFVGLVAGLAIAVPLCSAAERLLRTPDPGSVVLDEIAALPLAYLGWWLMESARRGHWPTLGEVQNARFWLWVLAGFVLFRLLDALKPPPIGHLQRLPAGWGIVADDVAAGAIAGLILAGARWVWSA